MSDESLRSSSKDVSESSLSRLSQFFRKNKEGAVKGVASIRLVQKAGKRTNSITMIPTLALDCGGVERKHRSRENAVRLRLERVDK